MEPSVTGDRIFIRDVTYFQLTKINSRDKQFVFTTTSCNGSSPTAIIMWYQSITAHSSTPGIYVHPYYFFRTESNYPKGLSSGNDTNTTKHYLPAKYSTTLSE